MKKNDAVSLLSRLGEKGMLNKPALKEINEDIRKFLKDLPGEENEARNFSN